MSAIGGLNMTEHESIERLRGMVSAVPRRIERETAWMRTVIGAAITMSIGIMTGTMADCTFAYTREDRELGEATAPTN